MDYTLPQNLNSEKDASDVMNRAPEIIADLEDSLFVAKEQLANEMARVRLANREEKDQIIKAMIQQDTQVKEKKVQQKNIETLLTRWKEANANAKYFYKSFH